MSQIIEIKLLKIINTLVDCGSVKTTAKLLNITPAAVSYSLNKLRDITGEHLFIRTRDGMKPNTTAYELSQRYKKFFATDAYIRKGAAVEEQGNLTILTYSPVEMLLSKAISGLSNIADHYRYVFLPYTINVNERMDNLNIESDYIDIGAELPQNNAVSKVKLFSSNISILAGVNNSTISDTVTRTDLYRVRHAIWSSLGDYYCETMQSSGEVKKYINERDVAIVSGSIINMVELCSRSNYIMLLPDVFIPMFTKIFPVRRIELPEELKMKHDCYMHFNKKTSEKTTITRLIDDIIHSVKSGFT